MTASPSLNIAVLNADIPVPAVRSVRGEYSDVFADLLHSACKRLGSSAGGTLSFKGYDVINGEYPPNLSECDGILITGSHASAYYQEPWILELNTFIQDVYRDHPKIRFFGSCFGHQIICQALLSQHGGCVTKDPEGWEIGVHAVTLTPAFCSTLKQSLLHRLPVCPTQLRMQFIHADHVVLPPTGRLPHGWIVVGSSDHCAVQGVMQPGRVLTYQGHFEFDRFINGETFKVFTAEWDPAVKEPYERYIDADDDADLAAEIAAMFLLNGLEVSHAHTGLLTPVEES